MAETQQSGDFSAWNPGIEPEIPPDYRELETIYAPPNVFTTFDQIKRLVAETGLKPLDLVNFRPHRLALHELIVRVTADIVVVEGEAEEDLGINFRAITHHIFDAYVAPRMGEIEQEYQQFSRRIVQLVEQHLAQAIAQLTPPKAPPPSLWQRLTGTKPKPVGSDKTREEREFELVEQLKSRGLASPDQIESAVLRSLHKVLAAVYTKRGFIGNDRDYLAQICVLHACNYLAGRRIGQLVGEWVDAAIEAEGYRLIADASRPVLISLKGASASGKSHLRPMMRSLLADLGIEDGDYGTISPDIWRKLLLDYAQLGASYKYAGRFTSHEVSVIDARLDRYIRAKADAHRSIPHLVVDRFRFDSFASDKIARVLHKTYVRYIDTLYMYFVITRPEDTVERGWQRGLERGRYKAVEDYLGHCVEAYSGMPKLLFKWIAYDRPRFIFEFLDNSVPKGTYPNPVARGTQGSMQIFEPARLLDIERFQRIDIHATTAEAVAAGANQVTLKNSVDFLRQCIRRIARVDFVDRDTEQVYLASRSAVFEIVDQSLFEAKLADPTLRQIITELAPELPAE
jgi:hypothetical protein